VAVDAEEIGGATNLPARTTTRRATLDARPFYPTLGGRHSDEWWPGGQHRLTSGPAIGLSATDRWAALNSFSKSNFNAEIELSTGK
jgi:hypothetical protein